MFDISKTYFTFYSNESTIDRRSIYPHHCIKNIYRKKSNPYLVQVNVAECGYRKTVYEIVQTII